MFSPPDPPLSPPPPPQGCPLHLVEVEGKASIDEFLGMMEPYSVWRNFGMQGPPDPFKWQLNFHKGRTFGHFIVETQTDRKVGILVLHSNKYRTEGVLECDIAITSDEDRGKGYSKMGMALLWDAWLLTGRAKQLWAWADVGNTASIKMLESMEVPVLRKTRQDAEMVDGVVDTVEFHIDADAWRRNMARTRWRDPADLPDGLF